MRLDLAFKERVDVLFERYILIIAQFGIRFRISVLVSANFRGVVALG